MRLDNITKSIVIEEITKRRASQLKGMNLFKTSTYKNASYWYNQFKLGYDNTFTYTYIKQAVQDNLLPF